eukprot:Nitzschia sp. Nitz4//scaffold77_size91520//45176//46905//NITZ4_004891-RA/size91520-snap-gene-0.14-mRNA-1//-1//CDS//3329557994//7024//frame0
MFHWLLLSFLPVVFGATTPRSVSVYVRNDSGVRIELSWVNPKDGYLHPMTVLDHDEDYVLHTYEGHQFEVLELPSSPSSNCVLKHLLDPIDVKPLEWIEGDCAAYTFSITPGVTLHHYFVDSKFQVKFKEISTSSSPFAQRIASRIDGSGNDDMSSILSMCRFQVKKKLVKLNSLRSVSGSDKKAMEGVLMHQYESCISQGVQPHFLSLTHGVDFEAELRTEVAMKMENFTCLADLSGRPTPPNHEWVSHQDGQSRQVFVHLDRPTAQIHAIPNFVSQQECEAIQAQIEDQLVPAVIEDGKGGVKIHPGRKAMQAYLDPDWSLEEQGDPIASLDRRIFEYASHVLGINMTVEGQEPLFAIQYTGRGFNDTHPDQYQPHCDGKCKGKPLFHSSRMATMVLYCGVPDLDGGGSTNFQNAGVTVAPSLYSGVFFSYIDPATKITDKGFTQHSGCPVYKGSKFIITQWMRLGVNASMTYEAYNSLEVPWSDDDPPPAGFS